MAEATAPGKLILCGEHAVVYNYPAIALPLSDVRARVAVEPGEPGSGIVLDARDLGRQWRLTDAPDDPLSALTTETLAQLTNSQYAIRNTQYAIRDMQPDLRITITSNIPIASGMGSGAAVATALVRALAQHLRRELPPNEISALVYESERRLHGTPSGIDNTVVAYEQPIWFVRRTTNDERRTTNDKGRPTSDERRTTNDKGRPTSDERPSTTASSLPVSPSSVLRPPSSLIEPITIAVPFTLLIGDTGVRCETRLPVGEVRRGLEADPIGYENVFDDINGVAMGVRIGLVAGEFAEIGRLLTYNHVLLQKIGVSSPELDRLVDAARNAGALGAKMSGGGWGGVMLALVDDTTRDAVAMALRDAGATQVLETRVAATVIKD
jgi:mevalonate kinase